MHITPHDFYPKEVLANCLPSSLLHLKRRAHLTNISALGVGGLPVSESYRFRRDLKFANVGKTNSHRSICRALAEIKSKKGGNMKKMYWCSILLFTLISTFAQSLPNLIDYQGMITDENGNYINGPVSIEFKLYDVESGGTSIWSETQNPVYVSNGLFHVYLGAVNPITSDDFSEPERWIGINVDGEGEITPRNKINSVPYAFISETDEDWIKDGSNVYRTGGKVGIGTNDPDTELEVNGTITATSYIGDGSQLNNLPETGIPSSKVYDSGWFYVGQGGEYFLTHNLGTDKILFTAYFSLSSGLHDMSTLFLQWDNYDSPTGAQIKNITDTTCRIQAEDHAVSAILTNGGYQQLYSNGYYRVIGLALE